MKTISEITVVNRGIFLELIFKIYSCISSSVYSYDTRNLSMPVNIHEDHVSAVTSIDYAPTGREFVTGSYDKSVRIFEVHKVFSVHFS